MKNFVSNLFHKIKFREGLIFFYRQIGSLKLAVSLLIFLAFLTALGTFFVSYYDQKLANEMIYHAPVMVWTLLALCTSLLAVLVDRWPWRWNHAPFVLAHLGLITLIFGSLLTRYMGTDGFLRLKEGEEKNYVSLEEEELVLYSSFDGSRFTLLHQKDVNFYRNKPKDQTLVLPAGQEQFKILDHKPYGLFREEFKPTQKKGQPSLRFLIQGSQALFSSWLALSLGEDTKKINLGPVTASLTRLAKTSSQGKRDLVFYVKGQELFYDFGKGKKRISQGEQIATPWMDFQLRILAFLPRSEKIFQFFPVKRPNEKTVSAIQVEYNKVKRWLALGAYLQFFKKDQVFFLGYLNKRRPLDFSLKLNKFQPVFYPGNKKAKSYSSIVEAFGQQYVISMNEPLKLEGYTFYQSSFEDTPEGSPKISIFSVNKDPGRFFKYFGSFLVVIGCILLFYKRQIRFKR